MAIQRDNVSEIRVSLAITGADQAGNLQRVWSTTGQVNGAEWGAAQLRATSVVDRVFSVPAV